jgi:hypothetical protein
LLNMTVLRVVRMPAARAIPVLAQRGRVGRAEGRQQVVLGLFGCPVLVGLPVNRWVLTTLGLAHDANP